MYRHQYDLHQFYYASLLLSSSGFKNIAIVSSENSSKGLNPKNIETYSLFGDGAAAVIISHTNNQNAGLIQHTSKNYIEGAKYTIIEAGGSKKHPKDVPYDPDLYSFKIEGKNC